MHRMQIHTEFQDGMKSLCYTVAVPCSQSQATDEDLKYAGEANSDMTLYRLASLSQVNSTRPTTQTHAYPRSVCTQVYCSRSEIRDDRS